MSNALVDTEALVLRHESWNKRDRRVLLFCQELGLVWTLARGIRSPKAKLTAILDSGMLIRVQLASKHNRFVATRGEIIEAYPRFRIQPLKGLAALSISQLITFTQSAGAADEVFWLKIKKLLNWIHDSPETDSHILKNQLRVILLTLLALLLKNAGHTPELKQCVAAGGRHSKSLAYYSFSEGGIVCSHHTSEISVVPLSKPAKEKLTVILKLPLRLPPINQSLIHELEQILWPTAIYHLELPENTKYAIASLANLS